jgi:hypothetical protein
LLHGHGDVLEGFAKITGNELLAMGVLFAVRVTCAEIADRDEFLGQLLLHGEDSRVLGVIDEVMKVVEGIDGVILSMMLIFMASMAGTKMADMLGSVAGSITCRKWNGRCSRDGRGGERWCRDRRGGSKRAEKPKGHERLAEELHLQ